MEIQIVDDDVDRHLQVPNGKTNASGYATFVGLGLGTFHVGTGHLLSKIAMTGFGKKRGTLLEKPPLFCLQWHTSPLGSCAIVRHGP